MLSLHRDSDTALGLSLFEALRENIYSEVASLISQNEGRPHYLIELFRELQLLSSDYLRQRALYALKDLVAQTLNHEDDGSVHAVSFHLRHFARYVATGNGSTDFCCPTTHARNWKGTNVIRFGTKRISAIEAIKHGGICWR